MNGSVPREIVEDSDESVDIRQEKTESDTQILTDSDEPSSSHNKAKKRHRKCLEHFYDPKDEIPAKYHHIRESLRKIQPKFNETADKLKSCNPMSESQAKAAVITVGNEMYGRSWKSHNESAVIHLDTEPQASNIK